MCTTWEPLGITGALLVVSATTPFLPMDELCLQHVNGWESGQRGFNPVGM